MRFSVNGKDESDSYGSLVKKAAGIQARYLTRTPNFLIASLSWSAFRSGSSLL